MLIKYPKIHNLGTSETTGILDEIVVIESKIDGANFRCRFDKENDKLIYGSRSLELLPNTNENKWFAIRSYKKAFIEHHDNFIPNVIYYSESMQKHTLSYENIPDTIGYDIFDIERNEFYDWKAAKQAFENIGIPFINVHYEGKVNNLDIKDLEKYIKNSPYRKEGDEGIVIKCYKKLNIYGRPLFAKIVDPLFKEQNKSVFKASSQRVESNSVKIIDQYFNKARFIKAIYHLKDAGEMIDMPLIPKLYKYMYNDILSENILEISKDYDRVEFKELENFVAKKTAKELREYLIKGDNYGKM